MTDIGRNCLLAAAALVLSCGDVKGPGDFESELDEDMGAGSTYDGEEEAIEGDPCAQDSPWECDPISGEGCEGEGVACGFWAGSEPGFYCLTGSTEPAGAACDAENGPWCGQGSMCLAAGEGTAGTCAPFCCSQEDCSAFGGDCVEQDWSPVQATLGLCVVEGDSPDAGPDSGD